jgi:4-hydroxy-tetrahydrodipicolinate synthase
MYSYLKGTGVALVTPFTAEGKVDEAGLLKLLAHTAPHIEYWVVHGTTGESVTTTAEEKAHILQLIKKNNPTQHPLVYGLGGNHTQHILEELKRIDFEGISAILSVSPYYNKPSQEGIYQHYITIADASPVPIILYNVPGRTSSNLSVQTILRLANHPNIIGIKEASGDFMHALRIVKDKPKDFLLISGDDMLTVPMISYGAVGVISVLANAFPQKFGDMVRFALQGDFQNASQLLYKFLEINEFMYTESNPVGVKQALASLNVCEAEVRLPLVKASDHLKQQIEHSLQSLT